jgi:hypothetical protein
LGVTQKPKYLPNINLLCDSKAGMAPNTIILKGRISHWPTIIIFLKKEWPGGLLGKSKVDIAAENTRPAKAIVIKVLVMLGRLPDITAVLKVFPPKIIGVQPMMAIISTLVAQE